jgi:hypothetical protein
MAKKYFLREIVDLRDEPVTVSLNVEYGKAADSICGRKHPPDFRQIPPSRFLCDPIPNIQRYNKFAVSLCSLEKLLPTDDVQ